jgi:cyclopropane fatty-acyl-phospholipid synthase-like methyltransferase
MSTNEQINKKISLLLRHRPALSTIVETLVSFWPEHAKFVSRSIASHEDSELGLLEDYASDILLLIGPNLSRYLEHYKWMCTAFTKEAMYFIRSGRYRCTTFAEADQHVYSNRAFMTKYMDGLLLSQVLWANHAKCSVYFKQRFLARLKVNTQYLEIGPGHGLFLAQASRNPVVSRAVAWDVSPESVEQARAAIATMGVSRPVEISQRNVLTSSQSSEKFDAVVISEVLEHMEDPRSALRSLRTVIAPTGELFVNIPVNSPAPDHIYLLRSPEEAVELVSSSGFAVSEVAFYPMTGYSLEEAAIQRATVSCVLIARPCV